MEIIWSQVRKFIRMIFLMRQGRGGEGRQRGKDGLTSIKIKFFMLLGTPYPASDLDLNLQVQSQAQMASILRQMAQTTVASVCSVGRGHRPALSKAK